MAAFPAPQLNGHQERNARYLVWLAEIVEEIPLTAQEWPDLPGGERAGFAAEWDNYMGMVDALITDYWSGELSHDQRTDLFALLRQIEQRTSLLRQMDLHGPDLRGVDVLLQEKAILSD